jgi:hypothetical protein
MESFLRRLYFAQAREKIDNRRDGWSRKVMARSPHSLNAVATFFRRF